MIHSKENDLAYVTTATTIGRFSRAEDLGSPVDKIEKISIESNSSPFDDAQARSDAAWKGEPANPLNWPESKKWKNVFLVGCYTFAAYVQYKRNCEIVL